MGQSPYSAQTKETTIACPGGGRFQYPAFLRLDLVPSRGHVLGALPADSFSSFLRMRRKSMST